MPSSSAVSSSSRGRNGRPKIPLRRGNAWSSASAYELLSIRTMSEIRRIIEGVSTLRRNFHGVPAAVLSGLALVLVIGAAATCGSSTAPAIGNEDGGAGQCPTPRVWRYETPGCGAEANPVCGVSGGDGCLAFVCGCDGEILMGCDYFEKPWRASGLCPGACYSPTSNLQVAAMYPLTVKGCACDPTKDKGQCVPISGGYAPISCSQGLWQLGEWSPNAIECSQADGGAAAADASDDGG